jgi:hypothetical protein
MTDTPGRCGDGGDGEAGYDSAAGLLRHASVSGPAVGRRSAEVPGGDDEPDDGADG